MLAFVDRRLARDRRTGAESDDYGIGAGRFRTQAIGVYWATRSVGIMLAPLAGGLIWFYVGRGAMLWTASCWALWVKPLFYVKFAGGPRTVGGE